MDKREGITNFRQKFSVSQCRRKTWRNPSVLKRNYRDDNSHANEGGITVLSDFVCQTVPKNFVGRTLVFQKSTGSENKEWIGSCV